MSRVPFARPRHALAAMLLIVSLIGIAGQASRAAAAGGLSWVRGPQLSKSICRTDGFPTTSPIWPVVTSADGRVIAAGVPCDPNDYVMNSGRVYLYVRPAGGWANAGETAILDPIFFRDDDNFGADIAISADGHTIVVASSRLHFDPSTPQASGALVFVEPAGGWASATQTAELTLSFPEVEYTSGRSVDISGDGSTIVVGAKDAISRYQGAAYVFKRPAGGWASALASIRLLPSDSQPQGGFGEDVSISDDAKTIVAGPYVFNQPAAGWANGTETAKLSGGQGALSDAEISADGSTIVNGLGQVFVRPAGGWAATAAAATLTPSSTTGTFYNGLAISANGGRIAIGTSSDTNSGLYSFDRPAGGWANASETEKVFVPGAGMLTGRAAFSADGQTLIAAERIVVPGSVNQYKVDIFSRGQSATFAPSADARARKLAPNTRYGKESVLGVDGADDPKETYLRFKVSGLTGTVQRATLRLYSTIHSSDNGPALYVAANGWDERTVTWNSRPARSGGIIANVGAVAPRSWVEYDVTGLVTGDGNYSLALVAESTRSVDFSSREGANPPQLVIVTAP